MQKPPYVPERYSTASPFLMVEDGDATLEFIQNVFDGKLVSRLNRKDGSLWNAELHIGDTLIFVGLRQPEWPPSNPMVHVYVENADETFQKALDNGAEEVMAIEEQFYGDRSGGVMDSQGTMWWIAQRIQTIPDAEIQRLANNM